MLAIPTVRTAVVAWILATSFALWVGWKAVTWIEPIPEPGDIVAALDVKRAGATPDFAEANRLCRAYLAIKGSDPIARLFYYFPTGQQSGLSLSKSLTLILPRGRTFRDRMPLILFDPRARARNIYYYCDISVEGREQRSSGPSAEGVSQMTLTAEGDYLGQDGAAGRLQLRDSEGTTAESNFVVLPPDERAAVRDRLFVIDRITAGTPAARTYLRMTTFASAQCYSDAILELEILRAGAPKDLTLNSARVLLYQKLRIPGFGMQ